MKWNKWWTLGLIIVAAPILIFLLGWVLKIVFAVVLIIALIFPVRLAISKVKGA